MLKKVINMPTQYTANMLIIYANMNFVVAMASILIPVDLLWLMGTDYISLFVSLVCSIMCLETKIRPHTNAIDESNACSTL